MSTTTDLAKISPAIRKAPLNDKASQLRDLSAGARDTTSVQPQILVRETAAKLSAPVLMPEAKPPVSVAAAHKLLAAERITKSIAGFYATNLRIDMKNFKRAENLLLQLKNNITDEESLKRHLSLLAKHLKQATAAKAEVTLRYNSGRISFSRTLPNRAGFTQSLVFAEQGLEIYTKWEANKQIELLRATRFAADHDKNHFQFDTAIWQSFLADGYRVVELNKALDIAERQRLKLKDLIAKINRKSIYKLLTPSIISQAKIKTDKKVAAFADLVNAKGQKLSLKVTRLVSAALLHS